MNERSTLAKSQRSDEDLERAIALPSNSCPRPYCWWWHSVTFDWGIPPAQGCRFLTSKKHPDWKEADVPCCRSDESSTRDHFERRDTVLLVDAIDGEIFFRRPKS